MEEEKRIEEIKNRIEEIKDDMITTKKEYDKLNLDNDPQKEHDELSSENRVRDPSYIERTRLELKRAKLQKEFEELYKELQEREASNEPEKVPEKEKGETSEIEEKEEAPKENKYEKVPTEEAPAEVFNKEESNVSVMTEPDEQSSEKKEDDGLFAGVTFTLPDKQSSEKKEDDWDLKVNFIPNNELENNQGTKPVETVVKEFVEENENQEPEVIMKVPEVLTRERPREEQPKIKSEMFPEEERQERKNRIFELNGEISNVNDRIRDIQAKLNPSSISEQEKSELQSELEELRNKRTALETELSELDNFYEVQPRPGESEQQSNEEQEPNEIKPEEKDAKKKEEKENKNEVGYKVGPIKGILLRVVKKIRSLLKDDSVLANWCDNIEDALVTSSTPVALNPAKVPVESLDEKKVEDMTAEDMKWLSEQAQNMPEDSLMMDIIGEKLDEAKDRFEKNVQIEEGLAAKYMEDNNIPEVLNKPMANVIMYESTKKILDMAKDEGVKTTSGRFSRGERRSLEDIYKDLDEKLKLREEMNKIVQKGQRDLYPQNEHEKERENDEIGK